MNIPKKLKIGGHVYEVRLVEFTDDTGGDIDEKQNVIRLDANQAQDQKESSLVHEILGAINPTMHADDHTLLASLSEQFYQVLSDNDMLK